MGTYESPVRAQWAWVHAFEHKVLLRVDAPGTLLGRHTPRQENNTIGADAVHCFNDLLCETLPSLLTMTVGLVSPHRQARVEQENAAVGPWRQQAAILRRCFEVRVIFLQRNVDVFERGGSGRGRADGEAETVGLVDVVVRILTKDDGLDCVERRVTGPAQESDVRMQKPRVRIVRL